MKKLLTLTNKHQKRQMTERNNLHKGEDAINDVSNEVNKGVSNDVNKGVSNRISQNISTSRSEEMTFWDHLDELRGSIIRMLAAVVVVSFGVFFFKDEVFGVVLAPSHSDFVTSSSTNSLSYSLERGSRRWNQWR